ncbi:MAG: hypothetical protein COA86_04690 [Kangiella sp.]|nr:MAG: hypothetical protein COA86_04690 [Kangiella sp.]
MRLSLLLVLLLSSCVISPKIKKTYDPICDKFKKRVALQSTFLVNNCPQNNDCNHLIGFSIITSVITGAVSIAIMSVGNIYYAIDHKSQCKAKIDRARIKLLDESKI